MRLRLPKPIISRTHRTWRIPPGMIFALVEDVEHKLWVVESCPAGTQFWTLEQASELELGTRTQGTLQEAVALGRQMQAEAARSTERQPKAIRPLVRTQRSEQGFTKVSRQDAVRPLSVSGHKDLVGV
jgi:hypothetical protein